MSTLPPLQLRDRAPNRDVVGVEHDAVTPCGQLIIGHMSCFELARGRLIGDLCVQFRSA